ncbi:AAA family ATPase [Actinomadura sp. NAK00032]|uniref:AAA family ATPase n=1 Tax=Actinomadura sp. NAK00032 TaxID=2742128 RepID=UPI001592A36C|nr:AAA family ATPase [Actinomadura sp. NAK00032]QKW34161.1 AAA family ATPase [Actinomadura sp. NAK00032]
MNGRADGPASGRAVRVLLAIADRDLAALLNAQFRELGGMEVAGVETSTADVAGAVAGAPGLDLVLLHQALGPLPALDLIRELGIRHPHLPVVLIAEEATAETFGAAMAAGARGVISTEPTLSELQGRVEAAAEWARTMRRHFDPAEEGPPPGRVGTVVAVCGAKGGTGATTVAVHLAVAAATAGRRVCLVDLDLQKGDVADRLDVVHRRSVADLAGTADDLDGTTLAEALFVHRLGPHLLPAPAEGERAEDVPARAARQILAALRARYEVVVVDCGAQLSEANAMAVELADRAVVAATPDLPALRGAKRLVKLWGRLRVRKEEDVAVLLNRHDRRNEIQPDLAARIVGVPLLGTTVPAAYRALEEAANTGAPDAVKSADFRKAISGLVRELGLLDAPAGPPDGPRDRGAASVDFAATIPLAGLVLLLCWQTLLTGLTSMYAAHAANEAARAVAVLGYDTAAARTQARSRAVARVPGPWGGEDVLHLAVEDGYAAVTIDVPAVLPGWSSTFGLTTRAKIVYEDAEGG